MKMRTGLILSISILVGCIILAIGIYKSEVYKQNLIEKQNQVALEQQKQIAKDKADSLEKCLLLATEDYQYEQDNLCKQMGRPAGCAEFVGSPKDIEFTKIRQTDDQLCMDQNK
jgi:hypothetical protein